MNAIKLSFFERNWRAPYDSVVTLSSREKACAAIYEIVCRAFPTSIWHAFPPDGIMA